MLGEARDRLGANGQRTILFLDEIHRFNKGQQDALLPAVESGLVTLIGATTENPYFEVNSALLSRCQLFQLEPLTEEDMAAIIRRGEAALGSSSPRTHARRPSTPPAATPETRSTSSRRPSAQPATAR